MYFCRICDTCGIDRTLVTRRVPRTAYVNIRPSVYSKPVKNTALVRPICLLMKDMAAIFVANGQGLIEVRIPNHNADNAPGKKTGISSLPDNY
jgi:hypothetical protein